MAQSLQNLLPRAKGGRHSAKVPLPNICHREIHASLKESDLARSFHAIAALQAHPRLAKFIGWVAKRPPEFTSVVPGGIR